MVKDKLIKFDLRTMSQKEMLTCMKTIQCALKELEKNGNILSLTIIKEDKSVFFNRLMKLSDH